MAFYKLVFVFLQAIAFCLCEIDFEKTNKLANGFIDFYNRLHNEVYICNEGYLQSAQRTDISNAYDIEISLKVSNIHDLDDTKYLKCTATVADVDLIGIAVMRHQCHDDPNPTIVNSDNGGVNMVSELEAVTEAPFVHRPIQLDNEVQTDTAVTSGEQFIAIPREEPKVHCIGCSSHVNPQAQGVSELAALSIRQLNSLEPTVQHTLSSVVEVERQVQVVNGVRFILTILIDYNSCSNEATDHCAITKPCKVTFLEKPWMQMPDGSKYRAILSNNCTEQWLFGNDGVVPPSDNKERNDVNPTNPDGSDVIQAVHDVGVQSVQQIEKTLTDQDVKNLEEQIIPNNQFVSQSHIGEPVSILPTQPDVGKEHVVKVNSENQHSPNLIQTEKTQVDVLDDDKKKSIDDLLNYFNFGGFDANTNIEHITTANVKVNREAQDENLKTKSLLGGFTDQNPNDPKYKQLAEESLQKYLQNTGNSQPHKIVTVNKVSTQVVSGTNTKIQFTISPMAQSSGDVISCESIIWEQPWVNKKEIDVSCEINNEKLRTKRSVPGGFTEKDPNDPKYKQLAEESLQKYLQNTGNSQPHRVVKINKVSTQVVAGTKTKIQFTISPTAQSSGDVISCESTIWEQPWVNKKEIDVSCEINNEKLRKKRSLPGGFSEKDPNDPKYKQLAEESLQKYLQNTGNSQTHRVVKINKVSTQVVSGTKTKIQFTISPTAQSSGDVISCESIIWEQPWVNKKEIDVSCEINNEKLRTKRQYVGGATNKHPAEPEYKALAEESLQKYLEDTGNAEIHRLVKVEKVTVQVVAGTLTKIDFTIASSDHASSAEKTCHSEIWERPWLNKKEITVNCSGDSVAKVQKREINTDHTRNKRSDNVVGGPQELDPSKVEFKNLARDVLKRYKAKYNISDKYAVVEVQRVTMQVIAGIIYTLDFTVAPKTCAHDLSLCDENHLSLICHSVVKNFAWRLPKDKDVKVSCKKNRNRDRRSANLNTADFNTRDKRQAEVNHMTNDETIQKMVKESLEKLDLTTPQRYKQKVLKVNSYSTKITSGKVTTIDFDVAFTTCLKHELVDNIESCGLHEHLPRRRCIAEVWERLWLENGRNIEVSCKDEGVPQETHGSESAMTAMALVNRALKHIEAKYPHPRKQKIVRIYSFDKQVVAGIHYRMKVEVGLTNCSALSRDDNCVIDTSVGGENKFCRVNVWVRTEDDHPPNYRVTCDSQDGALTDLHHQIQAEHLFRGFVAKYNPSYVDDHDEMLKRFEIFKSNVRKMHELNTHERGTATYGVTRFSDLTYEEFAKRHTGLKQSLRNTNQVQMRQAQIPKVTLPASFDWREHGAVTEVKNQGSCGSCWAFSVTGNIEGQWQLKSGNLVSLSEQELVDCDKMDDGCNGGLPDNAYRAIEQLGGLESENDYPYEGDDEKCSFNKSMSRVQITGAVNITSNETDMAKWLVKNGPISIGINANAMQFYMGGVSHPWRMLCSPSNLDHGVLIVGYGVKNYPLFHKVLPYWIVKNSWGPSWGEQGYYRVYRGDGTCGVNQMASSALI